MTGKSINAKIALCKCPTNKHVFGIRLEEQNNNWIRTWAFKIDEDKSKREGFDATVITGAMNPVDEYPGCPYCGTMNIAQCSCGKIFCWRSETQTATCPWCGQTGEFHTVKTIDVKGEGL
jgi:hypothetical protein